MEPFDPAMFPHRVRLLRDAEGRDASGAVLETFPAPDEVAALPCRVRCTITRQDPYGGGNGREVSRTEARLAFPANPGAAKGDRFQGVVDRIVYRVLAPARARDGEGALWVAECEVVD